MFDNWFTRFSPIAAFYNSLVVVKSAFKKSEMKEKHHYDALQTDQVKVISNYDPYAGVDQSQFITTNSKDGFAVVDKLMEDVEDDYCLAHHPTIETQSGKFSTAAAVPASVRNACSYTSTAYKMASSIPENLVYTFMYGAIISCNFVWAERKSLEDFVQEKSEKIANTPLVRSVSDAAQPKMRGFGIDFGEDVPGIKFSLSPNPEPRCSPQVGTVKRNTSNAKTEKINVAANIRFTQNLFGATPTKMARYNQEKPKKVQGATPTKMARYNQEKPKKVQDDLDDWTLV